MPTIKDLPSTPAQWSSQTPEISAMNDSDSVQWLSRFNDPRMLELVAEGLANNLDLKLAANNMDKAWLLAEKLGASLKPTVDLSLGRSQSGTADGGPSSNSSNVGINTSWELDIWGRIKSGVEAAEATAQSSTADYLFAKRSLQANVAKTYLKVIEAKVQKKIALKNVSILIKVMRITQVKYDNGLTSGQDLALNASNLASAQDQLTATKGSERDAIRALEILLGRYPNAELDIPDSLPDLPASPPTGLPSQILERRPDIVSAERNVAAAFNSLHQAKVAQLPRFSLVNNVSSASRSLSDVLSPANIAWQLGANLLTPLFDGGKRKIDFKLASVDQQQALDTYVKSALTAFSEVENNLDQGKILAKREVYITRVSTESNKTYRIVELRYKEGEVELLDTLQIQQQAIAAESQLISIKRAQLEQRINLYLALGGSW